MPKTLFDQASPDQIPPCTSVTPPVAEEAAYSVGSTMPTPKEQRALIVARDGNLAQCPKPLPIEIGYEHISLGDLHGNAMKLIYTLIEEGFLELSSELYDSLYRIYTKDANDLTRADIELFHNILDSAKFNNRRSLTLIGDELSDRGSNDSFMLLTIKKLHEAKADVEIMLSNHSVDFIHKMNNERGFIDPSVTASYENLRTGQKIETGLEVAH